MNITISKHGQAIASFSSSKITKEQMIELIELGFSLHRKPSYNQAVELLQIADCILAKPQALAQYPHQ